MCWDVTYWTDKKDQRPLEAWFDSLSKEQLKSLGKEIVLLEKCGNQLRLPHSRALGEGLFELRERIFGLRIYYTFMPNRDIVLLHAGDKASQKKDIKLAYSRLEELK